MSFGGPGGLQKSSKPIPPERGSFPLDHDGECKYIIKDYLACLRKARGENQKECRGMAKAYLVCRMENNLMAPDEMRNLGFMDEEGKEVVKEGGLGGMSKKEGDGEKGV
ncbi:MAG: hypothetical protein Q9201_001424 [Fulgogasparrea decipioides]